jgi:hypothetical protein
VLQQSKDVIGTQEHVVDEHLQQMVARLLTMLVGTATAGLVCQVAALRVVVGAATAGRFAK